MYSGLTSLVKRPSSSLKEKLEARLESHKDSMDILAMVLRIDVTQGRTVREVIAIAEEKNGELFLVTWRFIFELLGLTKDFEELVDADHWPMTDPIKTLENPLPDQYPRDSNHTTHHRSLHEYAQYSNKPEEPLSNKFKEPRLKNAEELTSRLQSGSGGTVEESQKTRSSSLNWPEQSLPPPSEDNLSHKTWKQTTVTVEVRDDDGKPPPSEDNLSHNTCKETTGTVETRKDDRKHHDPQVDKAKERKVSDGQDLQQIQNDDSPFSSPAILPVLVVPASQLEQSTGNDSRCLTWQVNSDHAELKAPESQCQQAVAPDLGEGIDEEDNSGSASQVDTIPSSVYSMTSSRGSSTGSSTGSRPVTHERANIPVGLVTVQQSHLNPLAGQERVSEVLGETGRPSENDDTFGNSDDLQQSLRERSSELAACQLELQSCRQQCGQQQGDIKELCDMKDQEIGRLAQLCDQKDQDNERLTEELRQTVAEVQQLKECVLEAVHVTLRRGNERLSNQTMTELSEAFLKQELDEEKHKRAEAEEINRCLSEELRQTVAEVQQLKECVLEAVHVTLRRGNERLSNQTMTELSEAFLKQELDEEKHKRAEAEEINRCLSEELRQTVAEVQQLKECVLEAVHVTLRRGNERLSNQTMTELSEAFLKQELDEEKHKRAEAEEINRCLSEKFFQLQAMVNELISRSAKLVEVPCSVPSPDTVQENLVSSSTDLTVPVEEADEESDNDEEVS